MFLSHNITQHRNAGIITQHRGGVTYLEHPPVQPLSLLTLYPTCRYFDALPWFLKLFFHSLTLSRGGRSLDLESDVTHFRSVFLFSQHHTAQQYHHIAQHRNSIT
jgi:hypothetical protein